ncbi:MAG: hypothetical protein K9K86_01395 [Pseudomonadales bacterium]|nr:hypothetical protein [Pseudomonadales bacterium]
MASIGNWDPNQDQKDKSIIDQHILQRFIAISEAGQLAQLNQQLSQQEIDDNRPLMKTHKDVWAQAAEKLNNEQLIQLVRFFTLAEEQLPGWEAGSLSPVIWLCRTLKSRGAFPDQDLIQWIKQNSSNKFLPYGNILDF